MFLPFLLLFFAIASVAVVAYGTHPAWGKYPHGIEYIMMVRQWEWPLIALAIVLCLALVGVVAAGKRKIWWLIGLLPVLVLIAHYLYSDPIRIYSLNDAPTFITADKAAMLADDDYVVGLKFANAYYAYPFYSLYFTPLVVQTDHDHRLVLMWSPFANRAVATEADFISFHPRDLEIVSMPANGLLVYNHKSGEFLNGITGLTMKGEKPKTFKEQIQTQKMTWKSWRALHPETLVMAPKNPSLNPKNFNKPQQPYFAIPPVNDIIPPTAKIMLVPSLLSPGVLPDGIYQEHLSSLRNPNLATPSMTLLLIRLPQTGEFRIFSRQLAGYDSAPRFTMKNIPKYKGYVLMDDARETSVWSLDGKPIDGPAAKLPDQRTLKIIPVDDDLYWGVTKVWIPDLLPIDPKPLH